MLESKSMKKAKKDISVLNAFSKRLLFCVALW